jgi:PEP-CTERM motif-containing protein
MRAHGIAAFGIALLLAARAGAVAITPADFQTYSIESFELLTPGPNVGQQLGFDGVYLPGYGGSYTFASGVTLIGPNVDVFPGDAFVHDFRSGSPPANDWGANGRVDGPEDVLAGNAYLAVFEAGTQEAAIDLRFSSPQARVGAFVTGDAGTTITLDVYGAGDVLLETVSTAAVPIGQWIDNFLGIERSEGIVRIVFRGHDFGIDALLFDDTVIQGVPEPGSALLVAFGLALLAARRRRAGLQA